MHERADVVADRVRYIAECKLLELRGPFWFQIPKTDAEKLAPGADGVRPAGYEYIDADGTEMVELHVDALREAGEREQFGPRGGSLSVRFAEVATAAPEGSSGGRRPRSAASADAVGREGLVSTAMTAPHASATSQPSSLGRAKPFTRLMFFRKGCGWSRVPEDCERKRAGRG